MEKDPTPNNSRSKKAALAMQYSPHTTDSGVPIEYFTPVSAGVK
jgi:hypothetical protein